MKKPAGITGLIAIGLFAASCFKENHRVRFKNQFACAINNITIGSVGFGNVDAGATTYYEPIKTGNFSITGYAPCGGNLAGSGSIRGKGNHKWTVILSAAGTISMAEDK